MSTLQLASLIISVASFLIPLIIGFKKRSSLLWIFIMVSFLFDVLLISLKWGFGINVLTLANIYFFTEYVILSIYYYKHAGKGIKYFVHLLTLLGCAYVIQTLVNGIENRNGIGAASFYAVYVLFALIGFYTISQKHQYQKVTSSGFFWVNVAILLGSSGRVILFLFEDYLGAHQLAALAKLWLIYKFFNVLINILFAVALTRKYE